MKVSYNWLKEYIDTDLPAHEVAALLTDIGLEVEGIEEYDPAKVLSQLVVGEIKEVNDHPNADRLRVTKVDAGTGEELQIVCGAPNVAKGQKVVIAPVGSELILPNGEPLKIKKAKIRGEASFGMICAEDEIGLGDNHDGIMELPPDVPVGKNVADHFKLEKDYIIDIDLTPNRADAFSHLGVARDLHATLVARKGKYIKLNFPEPKPLESTGETPITVEVENTEACPRYSGVVINNIEVKESPNWLKDRLTALGLRPINNIVDITNFILLEYGQPLHAFDADAITGNKVVVKTLDKGTPFTTLDEEERKLDANDLMICNAEEGMCMAGVFGGARSGVTGNTTRIFLESAYFNPVYIRKTANRHNLRTDAAQRYEKGTDPDITIAAMTRAVRLMEDLAGGKQASDVIDVYPEPVEPFKTRLRFSQLNTIVGHEIPQDKVKEILGLLEITIVSEDKEGLNLSVPPFKVDVQREVDVIEEVLRIYGYNEVPFTDTIRVPMVHDDSLDEERFYNAIANHLVGEGFYELLTNSIVSSRMYDKALQNEKEMVVELLKSSNSDLNMLRTNMLVSGLEALAYNLNRRNTDLKFFDFGRSYHKIGKDQYKEHQHLALYVNGNKAPESWVQPEQQADFFYLKGYVENTLRKLNITNWQTNELNAVVFDHGLEYIVQDKVLVQFGAVGKKMLTAADIKQPVFYADILWDNVLAVQPEGNRLYQPVSKYPGIRRDLALLLDKQVPFADIEKIARGTVKRILKSVNLFDVYEDKKLGDNKRSYAVSFFFEDERKTLTDKDVDKLMNKLISQYQKELKAEIR